MQQLSRFGAVGVLMALMIGLSTGCENDDDTGGAYSGLVIDSVTRLPIDSALVSLRDTSGVNVYTDSNGFFEGASFGSLVTIYVRRDGYETEWKVRDLTKNATDLLFRLVPVNNN